MSLTREKWEAVRLLQDAVQYHRDNDNVDMALVINVYLKLAIELDDGPQWLLDRLNKTRAELWEMV